MDEIEPRPTGQDDDGLERSSLPGGTPTPRLHSLLSAISTRAIASHLPSWLGRWLPARDTPRKTLLRLGLAAVTALLAAVVVLVAAGWRMPFGPSVNAGGAPMPITTAQAAPPVTVDGYTPRPVAAGGWEQVALPLPDTTTLGSLVISPVDPRTLYACTVATGGHTALSNTTVYPLRVWRTRDSGAHWTSVKLPRIVGFDCTLSVAADSPSRIGLFVAIGAPDYEAPPACTEAALYLSDDGGDSWMRIVHNSLVPDVAQECDGDARFWVTARHLFVTYSYLLSSTSATLPSGQGNVTIEDRISVLERSDDEGRTWERADDGIAGDNTTFTVTQGTSADVLTASAYSPRFPTMPFWQTHDAGRTWQHLDLGVAAGVPYVTVYWPSLQRDLRPPVYGFTGVDEYWHQFELQMFQRAADGHTWKPLPPLAVPGVDATHTGLYQPLGILPDGRLLVLGATPAKGVPPADMLRASPYQIPPEWFALWTWDPQAASWHPVAAPIVDLVARNCRNGCGLPVTASSATAETSGHTYLWLLTNPYSSGTTPQPVALYRLALDQHPLT